jgi:hypothetical protein
VACARVRGAEAPISAAHERGGLQGTNLIDKLKTWLKPTKGEREEALALARRARDLEHGHPHAHADGIVHTHDHAHGDHEHDHEHGT